MASENKPAPRLTCFSSARSVLLELALYNVQVFVGKPYLDKVKQPISLAPLPQRKAPLAAADNANGSGSTGGSWQDNVVLGRPMSTWLKIGALGLMFFGILFNYTILRDTKVRFLTVTILASR